MKKTVLFNGKNGNISVYIEAYIEDGEFVIYGDDTGDELMKYFGSDEHEYRYVLSKKNTKKFLELIENDNIEEMFSGIDACSKFRTFCHKNGIEYKLETY